MFAISFALSFTDSGYPRRSVRRRRSAFARLTRYSASLICPAIATAIVSSSGKIFWTTFEPTKKPFDARLSAARTTPSLLRIPTVVVMFDLGRPMAAVPYVDSTGVRPVTPRASADQAGVQALGHLAGEVLEQEVRVPGRLVDAVPGRHVRDDPELGLVEPHLELDPVVLRGPPEAELALVLGETEPSEGAEPPALEGVDEAPDDDVRGQVRLEDREALGRVRERVRAKDRERLRGRAVSVLRVLDEPVVRESVERAGQLLRVDSEPPPDALERDLGRRVLGQELEDVAVVLPQVERLSDGGAGVAGNHRA